MGGAVFTTDEAKYNSAKITNTNFNGNHARSFGALVNTGKISISNTNFTDNFAQLNGGAVGNLQDLTVENSTFLNNHAPVSGGAILCVGLTTINNNTLVNNTAKLGGAIFIQNSSKINFNNFTGNHAISNGGAVYITESEMNRAHTNFNSNNFTYNSAEENGGAMFNMGSVIMYASNFTNNEITHATSTPINLNLTGGGIYNSGTIMMDGETEFNHNIRFGSILCGAAGGIFNTETGYICVTGPGHFVDTNILNNGRLDLLNCIIEKNDNFHNYLYNDKCIDHSENNCTIKMSDHYVSEGEDEPESSWFERILIDFFAGRWW